MVDDATRPEQQHGLVVVANRLPIQRVGDEWQTSPGGLVRALLGVVRAQHGAWVGWAGDTGSDDDSRQLDGMTDLPHPEEVEGIEFVPVPLSESEFTHYYERISNDALWPLFHDAIRESHFDPESWAVYRDVNRKFADAAAEQVAPGGTVWVHDYHLMLVPAMIREQRPDIRIGFFLHIPFPPQELFMRMPWREEVLLGLLGADLIGFQRPVGAENFVALAKRLLNTDTAEDTVVTDDGRRVLVGAFPVSIDVAEIEELASRPELQAKATEIRRRLGDPDAVFLGVDRLDYTKGIDLRLASFGQLLESRGQPWADADNAPLVMIQVAVPGREGVESYVEERHRVEQLVGDINGGYSSIGHPVVHYLRRSFSLADLVPLYLAADVMVVTPRRDGMNLVAKEFVAAHTDGRGILILSEFAGAAGELTDALQVNAYDPDALVSAMNTALEMSPEEAARRMASLRDVVTAHDVHEWAQSFLAAVTEVPSHA